MRDVAFLFSCWLLIVSLRAQNGTDGTYPQTASPRIERLWAEGLTADEAGRFVPALTYLDSALCLLQTQVGDDHPLIAVAYNHLGNVYYRNNYVIEAYEHHRQALAIREGYYGTRHPESAKSYNNLANCYLSMGDYPRAVELYRQTATIREATPTTPPAELASVYNNLGNAYLALGLYPEALDRLRAALRLRREALGSDDLKTAQSHLNLGNVYAAVHEPDSALAHFSSTEPVYLRHYGARHPQMAALYENMGTAHTARHDFASALTLLETAFSIRRRHYGGAHPDLIRSRQNLGELWLQRGDYQQALHYFQQSLELLVERWGEYHPLVAQAYEQVGLARLYLGEDAGAAAALRTTLALRQSLFGPDHPFVAGTYLNLGNAARQAEETDAARRYFAQSIDIWSRDAAAWRDELLKAHLNVSQTYLEQDRIDAALRELQTARVYLDTTRASVTAGYLRTLAEARRQSADFAEADRLLTQALTLLEPEHTTSDTPRAPSLEILSCRQSRGRNRLAWAKSTRDPEPAAAALVDLETAVDQLTRLQTTYHSPEARRQMTALHQPLFEAAIAACLYLAETAAEPEAFYRKALLFSERNKSIRLLEAAYLHGALAGTLPDSLVRVRRAARVHLNELEKELDLEAERLSGRELRRLKRRLFAARRESARIEQAVDDYLERDRPTSRYLSLDDLEALRTALPDDLTVLSFFYGGDRLYRFTIDRAGTSARRLADDVAWSERIRALGKSILDFPGAAGPERGRLDSIYRTEASALYQALFADADLPTSNFGKRLLIVPDGIFGYLPFEALLTAGPAEALRYRSYPFLLRQHTVSYAYSISQWWQDHRQPLPAVDRNRYCLAVAPEFPADGAQYAPLAYNTTEARAVAERFAGRLLIGQAATRDQLLAAAPDYTILHLATHALTNLHDGDYAYLVLAAGDSSATYDKLYVKDLYALDWKAQLAVLSACETGIGDYRAGEGVISLGRGFAQAGVRATVSSLWRIDDAQTAGLMERFYAYLQEGRRKDDALHAAKLARLDDGTHARAHPFYWAGYVPYGNMEPLPPPSAVGGRWLGWLLAAMVAVVLTFLYRRRSSQT